jgi:hypothetical protein
MPIRVRLGMTAFLMLVVLLAHTVRNAEAQSGKQDYETYCADCYGPGGKGNGPSQQVIPMNPPPPDLTLLARKHDGKFPFKEVVRHDRRPQEYTVA